MRRLRVLAVGLVMTTLVAIAGSAHPGATLGAERNRQLTATLDGKSIPLEDVGRYYCDDFSYPEIRCSSTPVLAEARAKLVTVLAAIDYVTIYDQSNYGGAFLHASQDYSALTFIGWNDRISSFKGRNSETGTFYVDWFYSGTSWGFCCNTQTPNLGIYNNTFSSIIRT